MAAAVPTIRSMFFFLLGPEVPGGSGESSFSFDANLRSLLPRGYRELRVKSGGAVATIAPDVFENSPMSPRARPMTANDCVRGARHTPMVGMSRMQSPWIQRFHHR